MQKSMNLLIGLVVLVVSLFSLAREVLGATDELPWFFQKGGKTRSEVAYALENRDPHRIFRVSVETVAAILGGELVGLPVGSGPQEWGAFIRDPRVVEVECSTTLLQDLYLASVRRGGETNFNFARNRCLTGERFLAWQEEAGQVPIPFLSLGCGNPLRFREPRPPVVERLACTLWAEPQRIAVGQSVVLHWELRGGPVSRVALNGFAVPRESPGRATGLGPTRDTTYELVVEGPGGRVTCTAMVEVTMPVTQVPDREKPQADCVPIPKKVRGWRLAFLDYEDADAWRRCNPGSPCDSDCVSWLMAGRNPDARMITKTTRGSLAVLQDVTMMPRVRKGTSVFCRERRQSDYRDVTPTDQ